ncbi:MAG: chemotaxis protein CheW [Fusobacteria bacterium]|nr:chemotaxis protein CheW [Fusobacteriota bacterium]
MYKIISFQLANEVYGINVENVGEILKKIEIAEVPNTNPYIEGVINLRGNVIPVVNLVKKFNLKQNRDNNLEDKIIVIDDIEEQVGVLVDDVREVIKIEADMIEEVPKIYTELPKEFYAGVVNIEGRMIILLDILKILSLKEEEV